MREVTLAEVLAGAERAADRVAQWPAWKRAIGKLECANREDKLPDQAHNNPCPNPSREV